MAGVRSVRAWAGRASWRRPPVDWGPQDTDPRFSDREEPAEIRGQGEKAGSHRLPLPRGNGQGMRNRRGQISQTEADSASAPDKMTNLSATLHTCRLRDLPQSLDTDASPPRCSPHLFIKSLFSRPIHIFKSVGMKRNFDHCLICHSYEVTADCGDGT